MAARRAPDPGCASAPAAGRAGPAADPSRRGGRPAGDARGRHGPAHRAPTWCSGGGGFAGGHRPARLPGRGARPRRGLGGRRDPGRGPGRVRPGAGPAQRAGVALPRSRCRRATGTSPSRPPGSSRPTWSPTRRGAFPAGSRPTRRPMGAPSAGRSPRRPRRRPGPWPIGTGGRCGSSFPVRTWCGTARSARRSRPGCASTGPAGFTWWPRPGWPQPSGRSRRASRSSRSAGVTGPPVSAAHPGGRVGGGGGAGRRRPGPRRGAGAGAPAGSGRRR